MSRQIKARKRSWTFPSDFSTFDLPTYLGDSVLDQGPVKTVREAEMRQAALDYLDMCAYLRHRAEF
jgi:hypothetical protein